jgi:hypothetical protein
LASVKLGVVKLKKVGLHFGLDLNDNQKQQCQNLFDICVNKKGGYVRVEFKTPAKQRSTGANSQNAHLNGHIQQLCEETGNKFDIVKEVVKDRAIEMGYPMLDGVLKYNMIGLKMGQSESDSSVEECKILIDAVHIIADEMEFKLREGIE